MKCTTTQFIAEQGQKLKHIIDTVNEESKGLEEQILNRQEGDNKWSMLQCIEHLSLANGIYVDNIQSALTMADKDTQSDLFKSHWKGDMFTKMIAPKANEEIKTKMKTMKTMHPQSQLNAAETIRKFNDVHLKLIELLNKSGEYNLNKVKVPTALGSMVKLRLGDAFRFLIAHAERHLIQLKRIKAAVQSSN